MEFACGPALYKLQGTFEIGVQYTTLTMTHNLVGTSQLYNRKCTLIWKESITWQAFIAIVCLLIIS